MKDPARKPPLSGEDIEQVTHYSIVRTRTPGLQRMSSIEFILLFGGGFVISLIIYINFGISRFLPIEVDPVTANRIELIAFGGLLLTGAAWLLVIGNLILSVAEAAIGRIAPRKASVTCPICTVHNPIDRYLDGIGCARCGSHLVYCEKSGKPVEVEQFLAGIGCPHCKNKQFYAK